MLHTDMDKVSVGAGRGVMWIAGLWCSGVLRHPGIVHQHNFGPGHSVLEQKVTLRLTRIEKEYKNQEPKNQVKSRYRQIKVAPATRGRVASNGCWGRQMATAPTPVRSAVSTRT
jgi:hypothetical protein